MRAAFYWGTIGVFALAIVLALPFFLLAWCAAALWSWAEEDFKR